MAALSASPRALLRVRATGLWQRLAVLAVVVGLAYLVVVPLFRLQELAMADGGRAYGDAVGNDRVIDALVTTIVLALGSLAIAMVLGTALAFTATRLPSRYRFLRALPLLPIVVPSVASVVGWAFLLSPGPGYLNGLLRVLPWWDHRSEGPVDVYTLPWIVIITGFGLVPFAYTFMNAGLQNIGSDQIEAAQVSGSSQLGVFFRVVLPLLRPSLVYGTGVCLLLALGQFAPPLFLGANEGIRVLTTEIYRSVSQAPVDYGIAAAIGSPLLVFGVVVVFVQKLALGDQSRFVTHGGKGFVARDRPSKWAVCSILSFSLVATVLPVIGLVIVAMSPFWSGAPSFDSMTLDNFRTVINDSAIVEAIKNSLLLSLTAVLITVPIGFFSAALILRGSRYPVLRQVLDLVVSLPLSVPAVVFGAGFLLAYTQAPLVLYGSRTVLVLVYVTLMLPFATRMLLTGLISLGQGYTEASRASGASALSTSVRITLPLMRTSIAGALALMFVLLTHEFTASLLVRAPTTQVMGTILYDYWTNGSYPTVAAVALLMTVVTALGVAVATAVGGRNVLSRL
ncbi:ABC transporter permease [Georgenia ruanii]|uniref:ABC transporter permease subunit n=1 Tax=Georgenia ruanii TaxID=348442 RepID=A0A7J9V300_9MICO|nr:iron ABC transporter permease [Georgenia ruanii]MPV90490.1 ABC transporter permease subunit [Georgenia ruanii]